VTAARTYELGQGELGFHVYVPIVREQAFNGLVVGVFQVRELFDTLLGGVALPYAITVFEGDKVIYNRYPRATEREREWSQEASVGLYGVTWRIRIWPSAALLRAEVSAFPEVVLGVGLLTAGLLALAVHLAQTTRFRALQLEQANQALQQEIADHIGTAQALAAQLRQMEAVGAVTAEITRELDLTTLLGLIIARAVDLVAAAKSGVILLWDETAAVLRPHAWHGSGEWLGESTLQLGEGVAGKVAEQRVGMIVDDYQRSPYAYSRFVEHLASSAVLAQPLLYRERLIGVIEIDNRGTSAPFTAHDRELLALFAAQAAIAIENARLYEALEARLTRLQTLTQLNQLVSSSLDIGRVLREIARAAATLMAAPVVSFWIVDEATRTLEVQAFSDEGIGADFPTPKLSFEQGGAGWVAAHRQPLNVPDVFADERFVAHEWWRAHDLRSFFGLPIFHEGVLLAVLSFNGSKPFAFGPDDQTLLESFMAQATQAIRNARLFAEIQERTAHLAQLNEELQSEIGERQRAEEALRASEQRFRSLVQSANDAIVLADSCGDITAWNQGAQAIFGYTEAEVLGQPLTLLMPGLYHEAHRRGLERLCEGGEPRLIGRTVEFYGLRKDGSEVPLEISLATWQVSGSTFFSGIIRDISARRQVEEQLHRQQEALFQREKLAAMGSLLASVAHELNNPLSVVMMQADLLSTEFQDETLAERLKTITQSAERCVNLVRTFLALARQTPPQRGSVALNSVLEEAMTLLTPMLRVDTIDVQLDLADDLPPLWADPHQLHQVVINLITNAHQALREVATPRRLTLTTRYHQARQVVALEVADTGPGIPPELQERIFEPFFTTKPPGVGTGLGLPFCRGIIEGHGGSLKVTSAPGQGTTFRIELPVEAVPLAVATPPTAEIPPPAEGKTILVVDDEPGIASALAYLLRRDGHTVATAAHGRLALEKLQEGAYDLILCDLRMPELDGPGFYRALEQHYPHLRQRIIFLTGDTLSPETQAFLEEVGAPCLSKPFRATEARRIVHQALQTC